MQLVDGGFPWRFSWRSLDCWHAVCKYTVSVAQIFQYGRNKPILQCKFEGKKKPRRMWNGSSKILDASRRSTGWGNTILFSLSSSWFGLRSAALPHAKGCSRQSCAEHACCSHLAEAAVTQPLSEVVRSRPFHFSVAFIITSNAVECFTFRYRKASQEVAQALSLRSTWA